MHRHIRNLTFGMITAVQSAALLTAAPAAAKRCTQDMVAVGDVCVDKYEASVWEIPAANTSLIKAVVKGKLTGAADLSGGAQRGATGDDYGAGCPATGNGCKDFYAVSIPGVTPSTNITWFQAAAACRNAGKHLATNPEWQLAALGTPDPGTDNGSTDCNVHTVSHVLPEDPVATGSRSGCVSDTGAFDMVGNVYEWVAEWTDQATGITNWPGAYGTDYAHFGGNGSLNLPAAPIRGGSFDGNTDAGVFDIDGSFNPSFTDPSVGFRCARRP